MAEVKIIKITATESQPVEAEVRPLWPELVEEDFEEVVGIVDRYAGRVGTFSLVDLEEHLEDNDVLIPEEMKDWKALFAEIQVAVIERRKNMDDQRLWVRNKVGRVAVFTLAEFITSSTPEPELKNSPVAVPPKRHTPTEIVRPDDIKPTEPVLDVVSVFKQFDSDMVRPKDLRAFLLQIDPDNGAALYDQLVRSNNVTRTTRKGSTFFTLKSPTLEEATPSSTPNDEITFEQNATSRLITEDELRIATDIMDMLTAPGTHVNQGQTIKSLQQKFAQEMNGRNFRKLLRVLEANRLVTINATANYGKARKSPKVLLRGQDTKDRWRNSRDGYIGRLAKSEITT